MVFCGKPSKGCSACRFRKVRCDQKEPTCGQCERRQQQCPGYRNMVDLMFRDESNHVIKKATTKPRSRSTRPKPGGPTAPPPSHRDRDSPVLSPVSASGSVAAPLSSSLLFVFDMAGNASGSGGSASGSGSGSGGGSPDEAVSDDAVEDDIDSPPQQQHECKQEHHSDFPHHPRHATHQPPQVEDKPIPHALLPIPLQERGTAFFFSRYVATDNGCYQNYGFIYDVWKPPLSDDAAAQPDCVTASMTAVGLAGLSKLTRCAETMRRARQSYVAALQLANAALRDPREAVKDSTMLAVLVLGTYEFISGRSPQTLEDWQKHVKGASALATMRGTAQFESRAGARMFLMLCHSVLISCVQSDMPMPRAMVDLRNELRKQKGGGTAGPSWRVVDPIYNALQIRHDVKTGVITDRDDIVRQLSGVEDEFAAMVEGLPGQWKYRRAQLTRPHPGVMGRSCHIYSNLAQATTWNGMRTMRMLVQETIIEQLCSDGNSPLALPVAHQALLAKAMKMLEILGEAVIASVPQHFGIVTTRDINNGSGDLAVSVPAKKQQYQLLSSPITQPSSPKFESPGATPLTDRGPSILDPTQSSSGQDSDAERFMTLATASNTIVWPLYTLGMSSSCAPETKDYIMDRLNAVYEETCLEQARVVAGMLQGKAQSRLWDSIPRSSLPQVSSPDLPAMV